MEGPVNAGTAFGDETLEDRRDAPLDGAEAVVRCATFAGPAFRAGWLAPRFARWGRLPEDEPDWVVLPGFAAPVARVADRVAVEAFFEGRDGWVWRCFGISWSKGGRRPARCTDWRR